MKLPSASDVQDKLENTELGHGWLFSVEEIEQVLEAIRQVMEGQATAMAPSQQDCLGIATKFEMFMRQQKGPDPDFQKAVDQMIDRVITENNPFGLGDK